jgi:hypothetical protein
MGAGAAVNSARNGRPAVPVPAARDARGNGHAQGVARRLLAVILVCAAGCQRAGVTAPAADTPGATGVAGAQRLRSPGSTEAVWHALGSWSGRGSGQTGSFDVGTGSLRVTWEARPAGPSADPFITVVLHSAISGRPLQTVIDVHQPGAGTAFVQDEPRVSYFEVQAPGMDWRLTVEEMSTRPAGR